MTESYHALQPTKICNACLQEKPLDAFVRRPTRYRDGHAPRCKECQNKQHMAWKARTYPIKPFPKNLVQPSLFFKVCTDCGVEKSIEDFFPSKTGAYGRMSRCKQCGHDRGYDWRQEHLEEARARDRKYSSERYWEDSEAGEAYRAMVRAARDRWHEKNPEKRRENWNRYNARKLYSAMTEPVDYEAILERDGMFCYICQQDILPGQDINFDHIIPVSRQGSHTTENIKVTHAICNQRKGDKLLAEMKPTQRRGPDKPA